MYIGIQSGILGKFNSPYWNGYVLPYSSFACALPPALEASAEKLAVV